VHLAGLGAPVDLRQLAAPDLSKAFGGDSTGYTDYPTLDEQGVAAAS
jgi:hypothetical protein